MIVRFDKNVCKVWELPRDTKVYGRFTDGSAYATVHRLDGSYVNVTTAKGSAGTLYFDTRVAKLRNGSYRLVSM